jgi:putative transposase
LLSSQAGRRRSCHRRDPPQSGISEATDYNWCKKYCGLMPSEVKRRKQLEDKNRRVKKMVADLSLDKEMQQDVIRRKI